MKKHMDEEEVKKQPEKARWKKHDKLDMME